MNATKHLLLRSLCRIELLQIDESDVGSQEIDSCIT
jgi:hypothetical protein